MDSRMYWAFGRCSERKGGFRGDILGYLDFNFFMRASFFFFFDHLRASGAFPAQPSPPPRFLLPVELSLREDSILPFQQALR